MSSRRGKTPTLGKAKSHSHYGTTIDLESVTSSTEDDESLFSRHFKAFGDPTDAFDEDQFDFGSWNPEQIPLLQRTIDQARTLGVKRTMSWMAGTHLQELPEPEEEVLKRPWHWARKLKVFVLTLLCIIITVILLFLPEETTNLNLITVEQGSDYRIDIDNLYSNSRKGPSDNILEVWIKGSFLTPALTSLARNKLHISTVLDDNGTILDTWTIGLLPNELSGRFYMEKTTLQNSFNLEDIEVERNNVSLTFETNSQVAVPLSVKIQLLSEHVDEGVVYGAIVLVAMYVCIVLELAHRTVIAMLAATCGIGILAMLNERPSLEEIITWLDIETLTLLFSMMVIVSILSETGAFNYLGFWAFRITKGKVWPLMTILCLITAVVSAFLDNVTTILLMTPVVIQLCEAINIDPGEIKVA
jgi:hypothetical protein